MNDERDPLLESLLMREESELSDSEFTQNVMTNVENRRRNVLVGRVAIFALLILFEVLLSAPLQNSVGTITAFLNTSIFDLGNEYAAQILAPLNSIAGVIGMLLLGAHYFYRRMQ